MKSVEMMAPKELAFDGESGSMLAHLEKEDIDLEEKRVTFEERAFELKDEFHITILSREAAEAVRKHLEENPEQEEQVRGLIEESNWEFRKLERFYHVQEEPEAETIIQMVEVPGLASFFRRLSELVGKELEMPPMHVTLYMRNTEKGIGLPTQAEFEKLAQKQVGLSDLEGK